jgi:hypothetical protein
MPTPGKIAGRLAVEVLGDLYRQQDLRRALAIATLNALVETLWMRDGPPTDALVCGGMRSMHCKSSLGTGWCW